MSRISVRHFGTIDSGLWLLLAMSTMLAVGVLARSVENRHTAASPLVAPPPTAEETLDSSSTDRLNAIVPRATSGQHRVVVFLDPIATQSASTAALVRRLAKEAGLTIPVRFLFSPQATTSRTPVLEATIGLECARRQRRELELLQQLGARLDSPELKWASLARSASITDLGGFLDCLRRRETASEMSEELFLAKRLRLVMRPSFVLDSTVLRGRLSDDSLKARLIALDNS